ncbi:amino acid ABC transporter permease [Aliiroseovarius sp. PTFE2010]|uniref:amino acid ABC transporter permease n=1 Tax=Aliiroseovarius sp. PTFE2010 TaxID=3417190 RepID=UPI003CF76CD5
MSDTHAQSVAYVRDTMLPQKEPPISETGAIKWLRENLFSGWVNAILTLASLVVVYFVVSHLFPWFWNGIWRAGSLTECREIRDAAGVESAACFAVIGERWNQLVYGFYPQHLYWRPNLAFVLMLVAFAPVLFDSLSRRALWFSLLSPFVIYWLIWGGSIWLPVAAILGFVLGWGAFRIVHPLAGNLGAVIAAGLVPVLWWMLAAVGFADMMQGLVPIAMEAVPSKQLGGFMVSVLIGVTGIVLSLPIGILLALGRQSDLFIVKSLCVGFIEFIRGVPLITLLFTASLLLNYFLPPGTNFDIILRVMIMVTLFASAYMAEVIRGGLAALPSGQYEAADALGLNYWKAQQLIIMPQALKISIPGIVNTFIGLFKDTTLVMFIGIFDMLGMSNAIRATADWNGIYWELFIFIGLVFWICCYSMSRYSQYLERKLRTDHH